MSLLINLIAVLNLSSKSVLPMVLDACTICLNNSSSLLIDLIIDPSKICVILHKSLNVAPLHQAKTISIKYGLKRSRYVSSSNSRRASILTFAMRRAKS